MRGFARWLALGLLLAGAVLPGRMLLAQCTPPPDVGPATVWETLRRNKNQACFTDPVESEARRLRLSPDAPVDDSDDPAVLSAARKAILATWREVIRGLEEEEGAAGAELARVFVLVRQRAETALRTIEAGPGPGAGPGYTVALKTAWEIMWLPAQLPQVTDGSTSPELAAIKLDGPLRAACAQEGAQCPATYRHGERLARLVALAAVAGAHAGEAMLAKITRRIAVTNDEWDRFLLEGKPMYPLDLVLTDLFSGFRGEKVEGFRRPPRYQWFLLHPAPALEYVSESPDGEQLEPAVYVELIGFNAWRSSGFSGLSLIATYADRAAADDLRYGVLFSWNSRFSFAATFGDGDTGILLSLDLAAAYRDKLKPALEQLK